MGAKLGFLFRVTKRSFPREEIRRMLREFSIIDWLTNQSVS